MSRVPLLACVVLACTALPWDHADAQTRSRKKPLTFPEAPADAATADNQRLAEELILSLTVPTGWKPLQTISDRHRDGLVATSHFAGAATVVAVNVFGPSATEDFQPVVLYVTRLRAAPENPEAALRSELDALDDTLVGAATSDGRTVSSSGQSTSTELATTAQLRVIAARSAQALVLEIAECVAAADAPAADKAACAAALASLDSSVLAGERQPLRLVAAAPAVPSTGSRASDSAQPQLRDGSHVVIPPRVIGGGEKRRDRRPYVVAAGLLVIAAALLWNRRRRSALEGDRKGEER
jgi:hypothetical protein